MTSQTYSSIYEEIISRAFYFIHNRERWAGGGLYYYKGSTFKIIEDRHDGVFSIWCMKTSSCGRCIYHMSADGGPGFDHAEKWELERVLKGMRADMVLDDLSTV